MIVTIVTQLQLIRDVRMETLSRGSAFNGLFFSKIGFFYLISFIYLKGALANTLHEGVSTYRSKEKK